MRRYLLGIWFASTLFAGAAFAQRFEVSGDYSYFRYNPTIGGVPSRNWNGGGGSVKLNFLKFLGIKGDFQGYGSSQLVWNVTAPLSVPGGTIPIGTYKSNSTAFSYLFGPVVRIPAPHIHPFAELLFGGLNSNVYSQLENAVNAGGGHINVSPTQHPFTMAFGGGIDVAVNKTISIRLVEADYVLTRFTNPFSNTNNQNNFRYVGGVVFTFGQ